jgi:hypothetical protein
MDNPKIKTIFHIEPKRFFVFTNNHGKHFLSFCCYEATCKFQNDKTNECKKQNFEKSVNNVQYRIFTK